MFATSDLWSSLDYSKPKRFTAGRNQRTIKSIDSTMVDELFQNDSNVVIDENFEIWEYDDSK